MTAFGGGVSTAFVEECRQEWKRLGVPDGLAEEMAAELESDLAEAEADGVSAAELLGESDPRRFAATWARERGLVSEPSPQKRRRRMWPWVVLAVFLLVVGGFVTLALSTFGAGSVSSHHSHPLVVAPPPRVAVPNVVALEACGPRGSSWQEASSSCTYREAAVTPWWSPSDLLQEPSFSA